MTTPPASPSNPYAAPRAAVDRVDDAFASDEHFQPEGIVVHAGAGVSWWRDGWTIFRAQPWLWIGMMIVFFLITGGMQIVPILGWFASIVLGPTFLAGLFIGARDIDAGDTMRIDHLFSGFKQNFGQLALLGLLELLLLVVIGGAFGLAVYSSVGMAGLSGAGGPGFSIAAIVVASLLLLILGAAYLNAIWFAPPLIAFNDFTAVAAMKTSFMVMLRNWRAFLVYALVGVVALIAVSLVVGLFVGVGALGGGSIGTAALIAGLLVFVLMLILFAITMPLMFGSIYASYRDCFYP